MIAMTNLMMNAMIRFLERLPDGTRALPDLLPSVIRDGIVSPLMAIGLLSIVCAMVLREGPLFRAFRIAIVTSHGRPASRARTLLRPWSDGGRSFCVELAWSTTRHSS
jgi:hypothetical protein